MGISGTIAATAAIASAGASIYSSISQANKKTPTPYIPPAPDTTLQQANDANTAALVGQRARAKAQASSMQAQTILTGPQGVTTAAAPGQKTLLGL